MTDLEPHERDALLAAFPVTPGPAPTATIMTTGTAMRRRRRQLTAVGGAGLAVLGISGFLLLGGGPTGRRATLEVTAPVTPASTPAGTPLFEPSGAPTGAGQATPFHRPSALPCPAAASPATPAEDLIDPRDHGRTPRAATFNSHAIQLAQAMDAVAARVHDHAYATAQADGASDDIIVWRTGGAVGANPAYAASAAKVGIPVVFRRALLSHGQIEATEGAMVRAAKAFAAAGVTWNSAGSDGHGIVTVGIDPLTDAGRAIAVAHAPYGAASIVVVCDQGAVPV